MASGGFSPFGRGKGITLRSGYSLPAVPGSHSSKGKELKERLPCSSTQTLGDQKIPPNRTPSITSRTKSKIASSEAPSSHRSMRIRIEEVECLLDEELMKLEEQELELDSATRKMDIEIECCEIIVKEFEDKLTEAEGTEEQRQCKVDLEKAQTSLKSAIKQRNIQLVEEKTLKKIIENRKHILQKQANLAKDKILEDNEQLLSGDEETKEEKDGLDLEVTDPRDTALAFVKDASAQMAERQAERLAELQQQQKMQSEAEEREKIGLQKLQTKLEELKRKTEDADAAAAVQKQKQQEADQIAATALQNQTELEEKIRKCTIAEVGSGSDDKKDGEPQSAVVDLEDPNPNSNAQLVKLFADAIKASHPQISPTSDSSKFLARQTYIKVLPKFGGKPEDWPIFKSDFDRSTQDCGFSNSENMGRLRKCLEGDAYKYVQSMMVSPDNVPRIMKDLEERYGQPEYIIRVMIEKAKEVDFVSADNVESLVEFGAAVRNFTETVRTLNRIEHLSNPQLQRDLEEKLPNIYRMEWMQWVLDDPTRKADLEYFSQWLSKKTAVACRICPLPCRKDKENLETLAAKDNQEKVLDTKSDGKKIRKKELRLGGPESEYAPAAAGLQATDKVKGCIFCGKDNHFSQKCFKAQKMTSEEKSEAIRKKNGCFRCLKIGHFSRNCVSSVKCDNCGGRHETIMCREGHQIEVSWEYKAEQPHQVAGKPKLSGISINHNWTRRKVTMLNVVVVKAVGPKGTSNVRLLVDEGSQTSYVGTRTVNKIGCRSLGTEVVKNSLLGGHVTQWHTEHVREVTLTNLAGTVSRTWTLREMPVVCTSLPKIAAGSWLDPLKKKGILFTDIEGTQVDEEDIEILIGSDLRGYLMAKGEERIQEGLFAKETIFGWTLGGPVEISRGMSQANVHISMFQQRQHSIEDLWALDVLGIQDDIQTKTKIQEEEEAKKHFLENVTRSESGRYCVALPFISSKPNLPSNMAIAKRRLQTTTKKLQDKQAYEVYNAIFEGWETEGIVEKVQEQNPLTSHYLPHHPVFKPESKTTPVRPVFDASCKSFDNPSLNSCLYTGPNLLELIPAVLHRFRERPIGVISDIRKAFQMVEIREEDRDYQRFLWWEKGERQDLQILRHARMVFGITSSPFLLGAVLDFHLRQVIGEEKEIAMKLLRSMYVDNSIVSLDSVEQYEDFKQVSIKLMSQAGMVLREWQCSEGTSGIGLSRTSERCGLEADTLSIDKCTSVLGLLWDKKEDTLSCDLSDISQEAPWTKRKLLSVVARIFDPIGYTCPATIQPKVQIQKMWKDNKDWDENLDEESVKDFKKWYGEVHYLAEIKLPRQMAFSGDPEGIQLHLFTDASSYAYAAVIFIRSMQGSEVKIQLVQAKSRLAPIKVSTIPRLELMGCFIGSKLLKIVREALDFPIKKEYLWTDSTTAIAWIKRSDQWGTFVANRVKDIRKITSPEDWRHIAGSLNPADLPSRGCSPKDVLKSRWWEGVSWLYQPEEEWPTTTSEINEEEVRSEIRGKPKAVLLANRQDPWFSCKFSKFSQVIKVMGWVLRFLGNCKKNEQAARTDKILSLKELKCAEKKVLQCIQRESVELEIEALSKKIPMVIKDGLFCVKTRLLNKEDTELFRWPVILPKEHDLVKALILDMHTAYGHAGVQFLLSKLREKYWILGGRRAVKAMLRKCARCKRHDTKPFEVIPAALPEDRVTPGEVFQTTGVDLAGPIPLRDGTKSWIVLFTCAVYRCVHFDVVKSLSAEAFLGALERFINFYGRPRKFYSDNGTNFVGVVNLMRALNWKRIEKECDVKSIKWTFNPPAAPWWGGWWERLVRTMKNQLRRILGTAQLNYDELRTSLSTVQSTMNDRPLTVITEDTGDLITLTPAMFLHPTRTARFPEGDKLGQKGLSKTYKKMRSVQRQLQERFRSEYLSQLVQKGKEKRSPVPKVGDVVLIGSEDKKRFQWPVGIIIEIIPGKDGEVRVAKVRTAHDYLLRKKKNGKWEVSKVKRGHIWTRALQRLYPLEISSAEEIQKLEKAEEVAKKVLKKSQEVPEGRDMSGSQPSEVKTRAGRAVKRPSRYGQWITGICGNDFDEIYE